MARTRGKRRKRNNVNAINNEEDRLSSLHDDILLVILSYTPLHTAIATSALSSRWRNLWTKLTSIHIDINTSRCPFKFWATFQDDIMPKFTSKFIHRFSVDISCQDSLSKYAWSSINSWFESIISSRWAVKEIKVTYLGVEDEVLLPSILKVPSLVTLELGGKHVHKLPHDRSVFSDDYLKNLRNLKKLSLCIDYSQCKFVQKLVKESSSLEDLSMDIVRSQKHDPVLILSSMKLKRLSVRLSLFSMMIRVDVPNLEFLKLSNCDLSRIRFRGNRKPTMLMKAHIDMGSRDGKGTRKLFNMINNVTSLVLYYPSNITLKKRFANLTHLSCTMPCNEKYLTELVNLLRKSPILEVLTLNFTACSTNNVLKVDQLRLPTDMLMRLKKVEMKFMSLKSPLNNVILMKLVEYLFNHAEVLEQLILDLTSSSGHVSQAYKQVRRLQRRSSRLAVEFAVLRGNTM